MLFPLCDRAFASVCTHNLSELALFLQLSEYVATLHERIVPSDRNGKILATANNQLATYFEVQLPHYERRLENSFLRHYRDY